MFRCAVGFAVLCLLAAGGQGLYAEETTYIHNELPGLGYPLTQAYDLNDAGAIAGYATTNSKTSHAVNWHNGSLLDLRGTYEGGAFLSAIGIARDGTLIGSGSPIRAVYYKEGVTLPVPIPLGCDEIDYAQGVNDAGTIAVGSCERNEGFQYDVPTIYFLNEGYGLDLDIPNASESDDAWAEDANNDGVVVGRIEYGLEGRRSFYWIDGVMKEIVNSVGGEFVNAYGINNLGLVVGNAEISSGGFLAMSYDISAHTMKTLGVGSAKDVNDRGQAVGDYSVDCCSVHAILYHNAETDDLHEFMPETWLWSDAHGINNYGWIVGDGLNENEELVAFLLVPIYDKGDYDGDGDVDVQDFGKFEECFAADPYQGPEGGLHVGCSVFDFDDDADLDLADYAAFQKAFTGPTAPDMNPYGPG